MSQAPNPSRPSWSQDILGAFALAEQAPLEGRLEVFLPALTTETVRLIVAESDESGEALMCAATYLRSLSRALMLSLPMKNSISGVPVSK
jgi:hypothetical protein